MSYQKFPNARFKNKEEFAAWFNHNKSRVPHWTTMEHEEGWRMNGGDAFWKEQYVNGKRIYHNTKGPVLICNDGELEWQINDERISEFHNLWYEDLNQNQKNWLKLQRIKYGG